MGLVDNPGYRSACPSPDGWEGRGQGCHLGWTPNVVSEKELGLEEPQPCRGVWPLPDRPVCWNLHWPHCCCRYHIYTQFPVPKFITVPISMVLGYPDINLDTHVVSSGCSCPAGRVGLGGQGRADLR
jgi:hypothetical protein